MDIAKIYRSWLEIDGRMIDACARRGTTRIRQEEEIITMMFAPNPQVPELDAIALGYKYAVVEGKAEPGILECTPQGRTAKLKHVGKRSGWTNPIQHPDTTKAIAYYLIPDSDRKEGRAIEIVEENGIYADDQIAILQDGNIQNSANLISKIIKVRMPIQFPKTIEMSDERLGNITVRAIAKMKDDSAKFIWFYGCELTKTETVIVADSAGKPLRLKYNPDAVEILDV